MGGGGGGGPGPETRNTHVCVNVYISVYIYIYTHIESMHVLCLYDVASTAWHGTARRGRTCVSMYVYNYLGRQVVGRSVGQVVWSVGK